MKNITQVNKKLKIKNEKYSKVNFLKLKNDYLKMQFEEKKTEEIQTVYMDFQKVDKALATVETEILSNLYKHMAHTVDAGKSFYVCK